EKHFSHGKATNYWGGQSNTTTHLLDGMHYRGLVRVVRRESGIRLYAAREHAGPAVDEAERVRRLDALADVAVGIYAPMSYRSLRFVVRRLKYAVPQWEQEIALRNGGRSGMVLAQAVEVNGRAGELCASAGTL